MFILILIFLIKLWRERSTNGNNFCTWFSETDLQWMETISARGFQTTDFQWMETISARGFQTPDFQWMETISARGFPTTDFYEWKQFRHVVSDDWLSMNGNNFCTWFGDIWISMIRNNFCTWVLLVGKPDYLSRHHFTCSKSLTNFIV